MDYTQLKQLRWEQQQRQKAKAKQEMADMFADAEWVAHAMETGNLVQTFDHVAVLNKRVVCSANDPDELRTGVSGIFNVPAYRVVIQKIEKAQEALPLVGDSSNHEAVNQTLPEHKLAV